MIRENFMIFFMLPPELIIVTATRLYGYLVNNKYMQDICIHHISIIDSTFSKNDKGNKKVEAANVFPTSVSVVVFPILF